MSIPVRTAFLTALAMCVGLAGCPSLDGFTQGSVGLGAARSLVHSSGENLDGFAVDESYVYWSLSTGPGTAGIARCSVDGCAQPELIADAGAYNNGGPVLAVSEGVVYYAVPTLFDSAADGGVATPGSIWKVMSDGGAPTQLVSGDVNATQLVVDQGTVFWSNFGVACGVMSCAVSGCATPKIISLQPACEDSSVHEITSVAVDATDVYFTLRGGPGVDGGPTVNGAVLRCPRAGCTGAPFSVATIQGARPNTVGVDATRVYWATASDNGVKLGEVFSADKDGNSLTTLASGQRRPYLLTLDDSSLFWTDKDRSLVLGVPKGNAGALPTVLASGQTNPTWIANDAKRVFWLTTNDVMVKFK